MSPFLYFVDSCNDLSHYFINNITFASLQIQCIHNENNYCQYNNIRVILTKIEFKNKSHTQPYIALLQLLKYI